MLFFLNQGNALFKYLLNKSQKKITKENAFKKSWNSVFWYRHQQMQSVTPVCLLHQSEESQTDKWADIIEKKPQLNRKMYRTQHLHSHSDRGYLQQMHVLAI